jgi:hypothetical protein
MQDLSAELFKSRAKLNAVHVPYKDQPDRESAGNQGQVRRSRRRSGQVELR